MKKIVAKTCDEKICHENWDDKNVLQKHSDKNCDKNWYVIENCDTKSCNKNIY